MYDEQKREWSRWKTKDECPIARDKDKVHYPLDDPYWPAEWHHAGLADTRGNRDACPIYIDSIWNGRLVSKRYHTQWRSWGRHSRELGVRRERFLERHPVIAIYVNNPIGRLFEKLDA